MLHPPDCPSWYPIAFSRLCLRLASALCPFHFVLRDSGRADLPTFPCVTNCRANGLGRATNRLLLSGIAQGVENVLHVAWLPDRCMTASHLTSV